MPNFQVVGENVTFRLKVKPRSRRERLALDAAGDLCLEVQAPPLEGQANEACVLFFARALQLPQACIVILRGAKSRRKLLRITGRTARETIERIQRLAGKTR